MNPFARTVIGYHGCSRRFAERIFASDAPASEWKPSDNEYDWLGSGIYFWEFGPARARRWAQEACAASGDRPAVVGAVIQLGDCFDLTDEANTNNLSKAYELVKEAFDAEGKELPQNKGGDDDLKGRYLDCLIINYFLREVDTVKYQTVRCAFAEGPPVYEGAMIYQQTHVQIAVIDPACIVGVFRPASTG